MWVLIAVLVVLVAWDVYVAFSPEPGDTISEVTISMSSRYVTVAWAIGVISGHLFWPQFVTLEEHAAERAVKEEP